MFGLPFPGPYYRKRGKGSMRLWHEDLLPLLPRAQLLGQHRECCALRGLSWGKKHAVVDYVFVHPPEYLILYHLRVMMEMAAEAIVPSRAGPLRGIVGGGARPGNRYGVNGIAGRPQAGLSGARPSLSGGVPGKFEAKRGLSLDDPKKGSGKHADDAEKPGGHPGRV